MMQNNEKIKEKRKIKKLEEIQNYKLKLFTEHALSFLLKQNFTQSLGI